MLETCWSFQVPRPRTGILAPLLSVKVGLRRNLYMRLMKFWRHSSVSSSSHMSCMFLHHPPCVSAARLALLHILVKGHLAARVATSWRACRASEWWPRTAADGR